jgi:hypothetical protein
MFLSLAESIAQTMNVTSCYVCGGTNMGDHWPWEARELDPQETFNETAFPKHRKGVWLLKTSIIGNYTAQEIQLWGAPYLTEPSPTDWPAVLISGKLGTISQQT